MILGVTVAYVRWCIDYEKKTVMIRHIDMSLVKTYEWIKVHFKRWCKVSQKSGTRCRKQDMGRVVPVSNGFGTTTETFSNTISIPLAIAGSRHRAGWLPALTKSNRNLPFLPVASWNPGKTTTVIWSSCRWCPFLRRWLSIV